MGILTGDMQRVVREQRLGFVATVCPDGTPNLSPKGTLTVWDDDHLVFADIRSPATMRNLRINPAVEINVVDPIVRKGYRFKGTAIVVDQGPLKDEVRQFYSTRWIDTGRSKGELDLRSFVLIKVEEALPLVSPSYDDGQTTDEEIRAAWWKHYLSLQPGTKTRS
ncbi:MAG TPA: pyridoxamine 5'-phosphate oxidase family protein [Terriglobales bacterium]|nr:pyridoxamine 5'-phosphate oxidase family protein [Terriglobales bacterium]